MVLLLQCTQMRERIPLEDSEAEFNLSTKELFQCLAKVRSEKRCEQCDGNGFPETWDDGATFHCSQCKGGSSFQDEERCVKERMALRRIAVLDRRSAPTELTREENQVNRGVRVSWLKSFAKQHARALGSGRCEVGTFAQHSKPTNGGNPPFLYSHFFSSSASNGP